MKKYILVLTMILGLCFTSHAQFHQDVLPALTGQTLLDSLVAQYKTDTVLGYGPAKDTMYNYLDVVNDTLTCVYSGYKIWLDPTAPDPSVFLYMNGSAFGMNTEHTYPQSKGASGQAKSDLHHLYPTRTGVNSARGNIPYGEINDSDATDWYYNDIELSSPPSQDIEWYSERIDGVVFEPREDHKGNVARSVFYFYTMYKDQADSEDPNYFNSLMDDLCDWHLQDPVDAKEWQRMHNIADLQGGYENPFVLDCSLVQRTYCPNITVNCITSALEVHPDFGCELEQNFPNPVYSQTTIRYTLHRELDVKLEIYDMLGQHITTLAQEKQAEGEYQYDWDRANLPSGIYWYQLTLRKSNGNTKTVARKMLLD